MGWVEPSIAILSRWTAVLICLTGTLVFAMRVARVEVGI